MIDNRFLSTFFNNFILSTFINNFILSTFIKIFILNLTFITKLTFAIFYNNVTCYVYFKKNFVHKLYVDIESNFSFIFEKCYKLYYSKHFNYSMSNNKKFKYIDIENNFVISIKCVDIIIRLQIFKNNFIEFNIQVYIISKLKCDIIIDVSTLKFYNIILF